MRPESSVVTRIKLLLRVAFRLHARQRYWLIWTDEAGWEEL